MAQKGSDPFHAKALSAAGSFASEGSAMALSQEDVRRIADYARIAMEGDELEQMTAYMNDAVQMLEPILEYNRDDIEPTFHPIGDLSNVMREDAEDAGRALAIEAALLDAASPRDRYFRVPSILGEGSAS